MAKIMFVNARSLKKPGATSDLLADILENNIQLCCVTETWFNSEFPSSNFFIPNYNLIRHDRTPSNSDKKTGGGVCIYHHEDIEIQPINVSRCQQFEILWTKITAPTKLILVVLYYPPCLNKQKDYVDYLASTAEDLMLTHPNYELMIGGDFNDLSTVELTSCIHVSNCLDAPTCGKSQLDFVLCSNPSHFEFHTTDSNVKTDHKAILVSPKCPTPSIKRLHYFRDQRYQNVFNFNNQLSYEDFTYVYTTSDPDVAMMGLLDHLKGVLDLNCPLKKVKLSNKDPHYITPLVKHLLKKRNQLNRKRNHRQVSLLTDQIRNLIKDNMLKGSGRRGTQKWWNVVNQHTGRKQNSTTQIPFTPDEICNFFTDISTQHGPINLPPHEVVGDSPIPELSLHQIYYSLLGLKKTAVGYDQLPTWVFKDNAHILAEPIHSIYNRCLASSSFPNSLKRSRIIPVPKSAKVNDLNNLRPIPVTPVIARHFERLVYDNFLKEPYNRWLSRNQCGFRQGGSTEFALLKILDTCKNLDTSDHDYIKLIFLDLSKAFDRVQHELVLTQLKKISGLSPFIINFIRSFITERSQFVCVAGRSSDLMSPN